ncbi:hypothetical protein ANCCAN_29224 [Ancylostoma caninum]|uniref:Uncharacterized protein n=1 Tax=Ancylostoma caninum TaxID=29170 RepID=A0A368EZ65_ANCCA|nr:hypothetical protein ANCCAN_29224 [Ancylostoma caninum]
MSLLDLWTAGQETTTVTLKWAFAYLLLHPQVKTRIEKELLSITKGQRLLSITDRPNTPYYSAVINVSFKILDEGTSSPEMLHQGNPSLCFDCTYKLLERHI